jgi:hypothetical protein
MPGPGSQRAGKWSQVEAGEERSQVKKSDARWRGARWSGAIAAEVKGSRDRDSDDRSVEVTRSDRRWPGRGATAGGGA